MALPDAPKQATEKAEADGHDAITEALEISLVRTSAHSVGVLVKMESISGPDVPCWIHTEEMDRPILDALRRLAVN